MINKLDLKDKKVRAAQALIGIFFSILCVFIILPFVLMIIVSFSTETSVMMKGYSFVPDGWTLDAYKFLFMDNSILVSYWLTIRVTVVGTILAVFIQSMGGFVMSRKKVKWRNAIALYFYLPTIMNPGAVAWYFNIKYVFNLANTFWVLVLPSLGGVFNMFLIRNYYKTIPDSLEESAEIDGAGPFTIFFKIMFPLALPITATVTLWVSLGYWNDWYIASWFIDINHKNLYPLQFYLYKMWQRMNTIDISSSGAVPQQTVYVAAMFVTIGPIIFVYPFLQKYFMKGIMVGAVKG